MFGKQFLVMVEGAVALAAIWWATMVWRGPVAVPAMALSDTAGRGALAARWLLVPGLSLLFGVVVTAGSRFFIPRAFEGSQDSLGRFMEVNLRYNRNTLEQSLLAAIAWFGLALALPGPQLSLIPALAVLFGVGRAAFWIGYQSASWARAFGFSLTFYPTAIALIWLAMHYAGGGR